MSIQTRKSKKWLTIAKKETVGELASEWKTGRHGQGKNRPDEWWANWNQKREKVQSVWVEECCVALGKLIKNDGGRDWIPFCKKESDAPVSWVMQERATLIEIDEISLNKIAENER